MAVLVSSRNAPSTENGCVADYKRRENIFLVCRASLLSLLTAYFTLMHEWICHSPETWWCLED